MILHWPQITTIVLYALSFGIDLARHGQPKTGTHSIVTTIIAVPISVAILYYGGFWTGGVLP